MSYVDIYTLPVPQDALDDYRAQASAFGAAVVRHGAQRYREFALDEPGDNITAEAGLVPTVAVAEFASKEQRDTVMAGVMDDPEVKAMTGAEALADMSRMAFGGYTVLVDE
ncbi:MAG: DUF1428 family protein [Solirubrobacteraceae bacterium]